MSRNDSETSNIQYMPRIAHTVFALLFLSNDQIDTQLLVTSLILP